MGYILLNQWKKGSQELPTPQTIAKAINHFPQPVGKSLLQKTTTIDVTKHREVELVPKQKCHSCLIEFMVLEDTLHTTGGEK